MLHDLLAVKFDQEQGLRKDPYDTVSLQFGDDTYMVAARDKANKWRVFFESNGDIPLYSHGVDSLGVRAKYFIPEIGYVLDSLLDKHNKGYSEKSMLSHIDTAILEFRGQLNLFE